MVKREKLGNLLKITFSWKKHLLVKVKSYNLIIFRPFQFMLEKEGKLTFATKKNVYKQVKNLKK